MEGTGLLRTADLVPSGRSQGKSSDVSATEGRRRALTSKVLTDKEIKCVPSCGPLGEQSTTTEKDCLNKWTNAAPVPRGGRGDQGSDRSGQRSGHVPCRP